MSVGNDAPIDPRFANLDANATIELCSSLADYGEAGGLSRDLMMQVGRYAEVRYGEDLEVLLAVARMYLLGGETLRSRAALVRAGKLGRDTDRVLPLLSEVLSLLNDPRTAEEALRDALPAPPLFATPPSRPDSVPPMARGPTGAGPPPLPHIPPLPALDAANAATRSTTPIRKALDHEAYRRQTTPIARQIRSQPPPALDHDAGHLPDRGLPRPAGLPPPMPSTAQPSVQRRTAPGGPVTTAARAVTAARAPAEALPARAAQVRTEVSRRTVKDAALPPPDSEPSVTPNPASLMRATRIRVLEPDDERRRLDPYELIGEIASGGMATVFLGRLGGAGGFSRFVAIKQLHPHLARDEQFVKMFLDEARLAASIHNPHVVPILEVGTSKHGYYLVMEFIEGDTLSGLTLRSLQRGAILPAPVALRIVIDALAGLHAAHQLTDADGHYLGLVHRDCTPQNILVGVDGSARVTDFGVARAAARLAHTQPQQVKGKVAYLSPEQAQAMELDRRSDIFTMGIVLWEALSGRPLFQADTEGATLSRLISMPIPYARSFVPDVPASLDEVCRRALHRDRNRRFRTAAEMAEALERAVHAEGFTEAASPRELGKFVEATMGAELSAQREAVRAALAPSIVSLPSHPPPSLRVSVPISTPAARVGAASELRARSEDAPDTPPPMAIKASRKQVPPRPPVEVPEPAAPEMAPRENGAGNANAAVDVNADQASRVPSASTSTSAQRAPAREQGGASPVANARALVGRLASFKMSTGRGVALTVLVVILATAPLWLKATNRVLRGRRPVASSQVGKAKPPGASPRPTAGPAWDEGDWALPEAGAGQDDPPPAEK